MRDEDAAVSEVIMQFRREIDLKVRLLLVVSSLRPKTAQWQ